LAAADTIGASAGSDIYPYAHGLLIRQHGRDRFTTNSIDETSDLIGALILGDDDVVADVVEALYAAIRFCAEGFNPYMMVPAFGTKFFATEINRIFREERVAFQLIEGQMVDLEAEELHSAVVAPTLRLLSGRSGFDKVEVAYLDAIREISNGSPADAITDAGTALQEVLTALGCSGTQLGPLIKDARRRGLLAPHDAKLDQAVADVMDWVAADRSQSGESHHVSTASIEDAWLIVHIVGSLILRLASGPPGSTPVS
jgi:hypothetical protein